MVASAILVALTAAALSQARIHPTTYRRALTVAHGYWHRPAPCGTPKLRVNLAPPPSFPHAVAWVGSKDGRYECVIHYLRRWAWDWPDLCVVTVHEYGHLIGRRHSHNPHNVMYPTVRLGTVPGCGHLLGGMSVKLSRPAHGRLARMLGLIFAVSWGG